MASKWAYLLWIVPVVIIVLTVVYIYSQNTPKINSSSAETTLQDASVNKLTNFNEKAKTHVPNDKKPFRVYYFYATWCKYCQAFKPEWNKFVSQVTDSRLGNSVAFMAFDVDEEINMDMVKLAKVEGLPDIRFVKVEDPADEAKNKMVPYQGNRDVADLLKELEAFIKK